MTASTRSFIKTHWKAIFGTLAGSILAYGIFLFINTYPMFIADTRTPDGFTYSGHASWFDPWDINVYYAAIRYAQHNGILLKNVYTTSNNQPILFYPIYTITGALFRDIDPTLLFHRMTYVSIGILLITMIVCAYAFLRNRWQALIVAGITGTTGGLGWFFTRYQSPDLYLASFTLRSALQRPNEAIGVALYFAAFAGLYLFLRTKRTKFYFISLLANAVMLFFYAYMYLTFLIVFFALWVLVFSKDKRLFRFWIIESIVLTVLAAVYFLYLQHSGFASQLVESQKKLSISDLFSGYGIYLFVFIYQLFQIRRNRHSFLVAFLCIWILVSLVLSYLPLGFSRFFLRGLYFPMVLLTIDFLRTLAAKGFSKKKRTLVAAVLVSLIVFQLPSTVYIFLRRSSEENTSNMWFYIPNDDVQAFQYLETAPPGGVLSGYYIGNQIPVYTNDPVYYGHFFQTPNASEKFTELKQFYAGTLDPDKARQFLLDNNIRYVYWGEVENTLGKNHYLFLRPVYFNKSVVIYTLTRYLGAPKH
jgi:hypothetical protein